MRRINKVAQKM